jgi:hypothetical protein
VPRATFDHPSGPVTGTVVYRTWLDGGKLVTWEAERPPTVHGTLPAESVFTMATAVEPTRVDVLRYASVGPDGIPAGDRGRISCLPYDVDPGLCTTEVGGGIRLRVRLGDDVRLAVVNASWYVPSDLRSANASLPTEVSASWAFVTGPDQSGRS